MSWIIPTLVIMLAAFALFYLLGERFAARRRSPDDDEGTIG